MLPASVPLWSCLARPRIQKSPFIVAVAVVHTSFSFKSECDSWIDLHPEPGRRRDKTRQDKTKYNKVVQLVLPILLLLFCRKLVRFSFQCKNEKERSNSEHSTATSTVTTTIMSTSQSIIPLSLSLSLPQSIKFFFFLLPPFLCDIEMMCSSWKRPGIKLDRNRRSDFNLGRIFSFSLSTDACLCSPTGRDTRDRTTHACC